MEDEQRTPPDTLHVSTSEVRSNWRTMVEHVTRQHRRIVVERFGTPEAALISLADFQRLQQAEQLQISAGLEQTAEQAGQAPPVQVMRRLHAIATEVLREQIDQMVTTIMRRVLEAYTAPDTSELPGTETDID